jgi:hypothetical protein
MQLNDPDLLRHQAYIDGQWCDASNGDVTEIFNPANGKSLGCVPNIGGAQTRQAIEAAQAAHMVRADAGQSGRPGADHDGRAGQAADRGAR